MKWQNFSGLVKTGASFRILILIMGLPQ
ncbi:unnamed protein product [Coffea canephora]|uniref:Uncharacterized protein n=1 Tax=Coffea canephora TaxID=49390 RepID=A0A068UWP6_COFCA|nr:unnamed protein product [Coffea canephora]